MRRNILFFVYNDTLQKFFGCWGGVLKKRGLLHYMYITIKVANDQFPFKCRVRSSENPTSI